MGRIPDPAALVAERRELEARSWALSAEREQILRLKRKLDEREEAQKERALELRAWERRISDREGGSRAAP